MGRLYNLTVVHFTPEKREFSLLLNTPRPPYSMLGYNRTITRSNINVLINIGYTWQLFLRCRREIFILGVLGFLKTTRSFPKIPEEVRSLPKAKLSRKRLSTKSEIARKVLSFIHFYIFRSLHGSELTYIWKLCQARRQQLTFFNQA